MIGRSIGNYEVIREIGRGGMGEVYLARDTKLDRDVAIKVVPPENVIQRSWHRKRGFCFCSERRLMQPSFIWISVGTVFVD